MMTESGKAQGHSHIKMLARIAVLSCTAAAVLAPISSAEARWSPGLMTVKVRARCVNPTDKVSSFSIWTPENGYRAFSLTSSLGAYTTWSPTMIVLKRVYGNTYMNWQINCRYQGKSYRGQKKYGGSAGVTSYSVSLST